jgi:hypothetical protein
VSARCIHPRNAKKIKSTTIIWRYLKKFSLGYLMIIVTHALYESAGSLLALMNELRNSYHDNVGLLVSGLAQVILKFFKRKQNDIYTLESVIGRRAIYHIGI